MEEYLSPDTGEPSKANMLPEDPSNFTTRISRTVGKANPLTVAATVLVIVAFYWAQAVLIPFALAILLTFLLSPIVTRFQQAGLGRAPSVTIVIALTFVLLAMIGWATVSQVTSLAEELPEYRHNIRQKIRHLRGMGKGGVLEQVQETMDEVKDEIEQGGTSPAAKNNRPIVVQAEPTASWRSFYLGPLIQPVASATLVLGLLIFMLAQREELRNRLIRLVGYAHLTVTTKALEEAGQRITSVFGDADHHQRLLRDHHRCGALSHRFALRLSLGFLIGSTAVYTSDRILDGSGNADDRQYGCLERVVVAAARDRTFFGFENHHQHAS